LKGEKEKEGMAKTKGREGTNDTTDIDALGRVSTLREGWSRDLGKVEEEVGKGV